MRKLLTTNYYLLSTKKGMVLILTFIIMTTLTAITVAFLYMTSIQTKAGGYDIASAKALWLAEAGIQRVRYELVTSSAYRTNPTNISVTSLGDGTYSVTFNSQTGSTYTFTSTGTVDVLSRQIQQSIIANEVPEAFSYTQHAGTDIEFKDASGTIDGDISAGKKVKDEDGMTINGTITEDSTVVNPSVNFDTYQNIADNVISGDQTFSAGQTYNGIWFVDGKATIEDNVTINGSIIATGDIKIEKSEGVTINPDSDYPALVSEKNIKGKELKDSTITGLIYAVKDINLEKNKDNTFNGTLISGKKIKMKDGQDFTINYDSDILSNPPPFFSGGGDATVTLQKDWNEI